MSGRAALYSPPFARGGAGGGGLEADPTVYYQVGACILTDQLTNNTVGLEVFCTAPVDVLRSHDQSGAYRLADEGKIAQIPGVTAAFEESQSPDLVLQAVEISAEERVGASLS